MRLAQEAVAGHRAYRARTVARKKAGLTDQPTYCRRHTLFELQLKQATVSSNGACLHISKRFCLPLSKLAAS